MQIATPVTLALGREATAGESADLPQVALPAGPGLRALLAVADPVGQSALALPPVDVSGEVERVRSALDDIPATVLPAPCTGERATLAAIAAALRGDLAICWLVAHAQVVRGEPCLWLEQPDGAAVAVPAGALAAHLARSDGGPLLVVLAPYADDTLAPAGGLSAEEGSQPYQGGAPAGLALGEVALRLAHGGIPAVLSLRGPLCGAAVEALMASFFRELGRDGQIGRAMAAARGASREHPEHGWPALFLRDVDGRVWMDTLTR